MLTIIELTAVWLLCGVLAVLLSTRYMTRENRAPIPAALLGVIAFGIVLIFERPIRGPTLRNRINNWRDQYAAKYKEKES